MKTLCRPGKDFCAEPAGKFERIPGKKHALTNPDCLIQGNLDDDDIATYSAFSVFFKRAQGDPSLPPLQQDLHDLGEMMTFMKKRQHGLDIHDKVFKAYLVAYNPVTQGGTAVFTQGTANDAVIFFTIPGRLVRQSLCPSRILLTPSVPQQIFLRVVPNPTKSGTKVFELSSAKYFTRELLMERPRSLSERTFYHLTEGGSSIYGNVTCGQTPGNCTTRFLQQINSSKPTKITNTGDLMSVETDGDKRMDIRIKRCFPEGDDTQITHNWVGQGTDRHLQVLAVRPEEKAWPTRPCISLASHNKSGLGGRKRDIGRPPQEACGASLCFSCDDERKREEKMKNKFIPSDF